MSETGPILSIVQLTPEQLELDLDQQAEYRSKTGKKVAMVEAHIVDDEMNKLPHDGETAGEIVVRAPWLTPNYYKDNKNSSKLKAGENYIYFQLNEIGGFQEAADDEPRSRPSKFDLDRPSSSRLRVSSARGTHVDLKH